MSRGDEEENNDEGIIIKKERHVSPNNHSIIRERIIKYFEDPKDSKALAEIKRLSNKSKKSSKNIRSGLNELNEFNDSELANNTELNRVMFKEPVNDRAVRINDSAHPNFVRRKHQFATTRYVPKRKNMTLLDELLKKENEMKNQNRDKIKVEKENKNEDKFDLNDKNIYEDKIEKNEKDDYINVEENQEKNGNELNKGVNNIRDKYKKYNNNYNTIDSTKPTSHRSNLRKNKRESKENNNLKRTRFAESLKPNDNIFKSKIEVVNDMRSSYNPGLTEEYKQKNNVTVENLHNKDKIVVNEYRSKSKDKKQLQKYKTEYVWDKNINRLVEKRIYDDENEDDNKNIKNNKNNDKNVKTNMKTVNNLDDEKKKEKNVKDKEIVKDRNRNRDLLNEKEKKKENQKNEIYEPKKEIRKVNIKISKKSGEDAKIEIKTEKKIETKDEDKKEEIKKGPEKENEKNVHLPKKEENFKKVEEIKLASNTIDNNNNNNNQNKRFRRFFRRYNKTNQNQEQDKPKKENVIIEKKTIITIEDKGKDQDRDKYKGRERIKEREKIPEKKEDIKIETKEPQQRYYRKRNYYTKTNEAPNNTINNNKEKEPEKKYGKNLNLTEINYESKYKKKPKIQHFEEKPKIVYSRKVIVEERTIPQREPPKVKIPEKKFERYEKITPYNRYKNTNIRLNVNSGKTNLDDKKDNNSQQQQIKNNPYSNYLRGAKRPNRRIYRGAKTVNDLIDDLEKIESYNTNSYLKDDLKQIYDSINEEFHDFKNNVFYTNIDGFEANMGDFDKEKMPYIKRNINAKDLCKGRVTTNDMYQKYSARARKFEREHNYK